MKENKGITLIALVITIIVLLILAGVSLRLVAGNEGILNRAESAVSKSNTATVQEEIELAIAEKTMEFYDLETRPAGVNSAKEYVAQALRSEGGIKTTNGTVKLNGETINYQSTDGKTTATGTYDEATGSVSIAGGNSSSLVPKWEDTVGTATDWTVSTEGILRSYTGTMPSNGIITVPNKIDGQKIEEIKPELVNDWRSIFFEDPGTVTGDYSAYNVSINEIRISNGITTIGYGAFARMESLKEVKLPTSITTIEMHSFLGCTQLTTVYYNGTKEEWNKINIATGAGLQNVDIICTDGTISSKS